MDNELKVLIKDEVALEVVRYDTSTGLVPVVVQDVDTKVVLMQAYANREALKRTLGTGQAWFWSRSRGEYWRKGATSGNVMSVSSLLVDCDGDSVLYLVNPAGPACHTGETTCFYRRIVRNEGAAGEGPGASQTAAKPQGAAVMPETGQQSHVTKMDNSSEVSAQILESLWHVITDRWDHRPQGSYTTYLFEHGVDKLGKKVGEEAVEVVIAAKNAAEQAKSGSSQTTDGVASSQDRSPGQDELASESADLLYHLLALWKSAGLTPGDVYRALEKRSH